MSTVTQHAQALGSVLPSIHRPWGQHCPACTGPGVSTTQHTQALGSAWNHMKTKRKAVSWYPMHPGDHTTPLIYAGLTFPSELSPGLIEPFCFMLDSFIILKFCEAEVSNVSTLITVIASLR